MEFHISSISICSRVFIPADIDARVLHRLLFDARLVIPIRMWITRRIVVPDASSNYVSIGCGWTAVLLTFCAHWSYPQYPHKYVDNFLLSPFCLLNQSPVFAFWHPIVSHSHRRFACSEVIHTIPIAMWITSPNIKHAHFRKLKQHEHTQRRVGG